MWQWGRVFNVRRLVINENYYNLTKRKKKPGGGDEWGNARTQKGNPIDCQGEERQYKFFAKGRKEMLVRTSGGGGEKNKHPRSLNKEKKGGDDNVVKVGLHSKVNSESWGNLP